MSSLKNLPINEPKNLASLIKTKQNQIVSMALTSSENVHMSIFTFSNEETVSEEAYTGDTMYLILEGETFVKEEAKTHHLKTNDVLCVPANTLHSIGGKGAFKVLHLTLSN